jgi:hypothetical protein
MAMLLDAYGEVGLRRLAQVDLDFAERAPAAPRLSARWPTTSSPPPRARSSARRLSASARRRVVDDRRWRPCAPGRMSLLRARYLDLDGTLLGKGASLLHDGEGRSR